MKRYEFVNGKWREFKFIKSKHQKVSNPSWVSVDPSECPEIHLDLKNGRVVRRIINPVTHEIIHEDYE